MSTLINKLVSSFIARFYNQHNGSQTNECSGFL